MAEKRPGMCLSKRKVREELVMSKIMRPTFRGLDVGTCPIKVLLWVTQLLLSAALSSKQDYTTQMTLMSSHFKCAVSSSQKHNVGRDHTDEPTS